MWLRNPDAIIRIKANVILPFLAFVSIMTMIMMKIAGKVISYLIEFMRTFKC